MAGTTRLELATSAVTGQRSNQLNYVPKFYRRYELQLLVRYVHRYSPASGRVSREVRLCE